MLTATALAAVLVLAGCSGTTSTGSATNTGSPTSGTATSAESPATNTGSPTSPGVDTSPSAPATGTGSAPATATATSGESDSAPAAISASPEVFANYMRTAVSSGDREKVRAVMTEKGAENLDTVFAAIPAGVNLEPPTCDQAGNSMVVHCVMMVKGAPFAVEFGAAQHPRTKEWQATYLTYGSTD